MEEGEEGKREVRHSVNRRNGGPVFMHLLTISYLLTPPSLLPFPLSVLPSVYCLLLRIDLVLSIFWLMLYPFLFGISRSRFALIFIFSLYFLITFLLFIIPLCLFIHLLCFLFPHSLSLVPFSSLFLPHAPFPIPRALFSLALSVSLLRAPVCLQYLFTGLVLMRRAWRGW